MKNDNYKLFAHSRPAFSGKDSSKGQAALIVVLFLVIIFLSIVGGFSYLALKEAQISRTNFDSLKSFWASEAGAEDIIYRAIKGMDFPPANPDVLVIDDAQVTRNISYNVATEDVTVVSSGNVRDHIRKTQATVSASVGASFFYGIQVDVGGLVMGSNTQILGNIISNGPITGATKSEVIGDAISTMSAGSIYSISVKKSGPFSDDGNARANTITKSSVENGAYYQTISQTTAGSYFPGSDDVPYQNMPLGEEQIQEWKDVAESGGVLEGNQTINGEVSMGPKKINGNLTLLSNSILTITGNLWVTGNIIFNSNTAIELSPVYGFYSGLFIADGIIDISSNVIICGSEGYDEDENECYPNENSYMFILSTSNSLDPGLPAIKIKSNSSAAILYTNHGLIRVGATVHIKEATCYACQFDSNSVVAYDSGLANILFSAGPSGGRAIREWKEIE